MPLNDAGEGSIALLLDGFYQLLKRFHKAFEACCQEIVRDLVEVDTHFCKHGQSFSGTLEILLQGEAHLAMIPKGGIGGRWNGVDCFRADQRLHVEHVAVIGVFGTG